MTFRGVAVIDDDWHTLLVTGGPLKSRLPSRNTSDATGDERVGAAVSVDVTLIDEMLRLSPAERLRQNDRAATLAARLQVAFSAEAGTWPNRAR
jgi:hypothetical protein